MTATSPRAFLMSATLHVLLVGLMFIGACVTGDKMEDAPHIMELVAGEGDNYMATEAPALGVPGGIKIEIPEIPAPQVQPTPAEPEPVVQRVPIEKAPEPVIQRAPEAPTKDAAKKEETIPDLKKMVKNKAAITQIRKEANDRRKRQIAEKKAREEAARKAKEEALKSQRMTKAEFDKLNKTRKVASTKSGSGAPRVAKIDADGIAKGVLGGSSRNKTGGAGGKALTREEGDAVDAYISFLSERIQMELNERPGVQAGLVVEVEIRIMSDGSIRGVRITDSSGSADFDQVVKEVLGSLKLPPRPKGLSELHRFPIRGVE